MRYALGSYLQCIVHANFGVDLQFVHQVLPLLPCASLAVLHLMCCFRHVFSWGHVPDMQAAPLWDSRERRFVGLMTVTDFIDILRHYR